MAGWVQGECQAALDNRHPTTGGTDYVGYSINGTSETSILARHAVGATGWSAATAATPSVKGNSGTLTSPTATGSGTVTHFAIMTSAGVLRTGWTTLDTARAIITGDSLQWAAAALKATLTG